MDTPTLTVILRDFRLHDLPDALDLWMQGIIGHMSSELLDEGRARPALFFLAPHPQDPTQVVEGIFPLWFFADGVSAKNFGSEVAIQVLRKLQAYACITAMEAWVTLISGSTTEREEALVFMRESLSETYTVKIAFTRDAEGKPLLGSQALMEGEATGRFTEFLSGARQDRKAAQT